MKTHFSITTSIPADPIAELTHIRGLIVSEISQLEDQPSSGETDNEHRKIILDKLKSDLAYTFKQESSLLAKLDLIKLDKSLSLEPAIEKKIQEIRILIGAGCPKSSFCIDCVLEHEPGTRMCTKCGTLTTQTNSSKRRLRQ